MFNLSKKNSLLLVLATVVLVQLACGTSNGANSGNTGNTGESSNSNALATDLAETQEALEKTQEAIEDQQQEPEPTARPTEPEPTALPTVSVPSGTYDTDFSDYDENWVEFFQRESSENRSDIRSNGLEVFLPNDDNSYSALSYFYGNDVSVEANVQLTGGSNYTYIALYCRATGDGRYVFYLDTGGYWQIGKWDFVSGDYEQLGYGGSQKITVGKYENNIRAICDGSDLIMEINGSEVGRATDSTFTEGFIGIGVQTFDHPDAEVMFFDLIAEELD